MIPQPKDLPIILFVLGYFTHFNFKSTHYPTTNNAFFLVNTVLAAIFFLSCLSLYLSNFDYLQALVLTYLYCICFSTGFSISLITNRLFLSPINAFPGPLVPKLTKLWAFKTSLTGNYHKAVKRIFDDYNEDFVRVGPNEIVVKEVEAIKAIYGQNGLDKAPRYDIGGNVGGEVSLFNIRPQESHSKRRKIWDQAFTPSALRDYTYSLKSRISLLLSSINSRIHDDPVQDIGKWVSFFAFDFMGDMAFGGMFELMKAGEDKDGYWKDMTRGAKIGGTISHLPELAPILRFLISLTPRGNRARRFREFSRDRMNVRKLRGPLNNQKDLFYWLLGEGDHNEKGNAQMTPGMLMTDSSLVVVAV